MKVIHRGVHHVRGHWGNPMPLVAELADRQQLHAVRKDRRSGRQLPRVACPATRHVTAARVSKCTAQLEVQLQQARERVR